MNRRLRTSIVCAFAVAAVTLAVPGAASAQQLYSFTVGAMGGVGGSLDANTGDGVGNGSFQLLGAMVTEPQTLVGVRYGQLSFSGDEPLEDLFDADLTYLTLAGEYKFDQTFYEAGMFVGLGAYELEGTDAAGRGRDDTGLGLSLGATGEFPITRRLGVVVELAGHATDLDTAQFFATAHGGLVVHF